MKKINNLFLITFVASSVLHIPLCSAVGRFYFGNTTVLSVKDVERLQPSFTYQPFERKVVVTPAPFYVQRKVERIDRTRRSRYTTKKARASRQTQTKRKLIRRVDVPHKDVLKSIVENIDLNDHIIRNAFFHYYELLSTIIRRFAVYPSQARKEIIEGVVYVSFILRNTGELGEVVVRQSSGNDILDAAAVSAIQNASPFPPLPIEIRERKIRLNVPISFEFESDVW